MALPLLVAAGAALAGAVGDRNNRKAADSQSRQQRAQSLAFIEKMLSQSRGDLFSLFPQAQQNRQQGFLAGLDIQRQAFPQMINSFQQGNVGAQNALLAGLPQMQNAILGRPVDISGMQAMQLRTPQAGQLPQYNPQFTMPNMLGGVSG